LLTVAKIYKKKTTKTYTSDADAHTHVKNTRGNNDEDDDDNDNGGQQQTDDDGWMRETMTRT